jgi:hypothetical protein
LKEPFDCHGFTWFKDLRDGDSDTAANHDPRSFNVARDGVSGCMIGISNMAQPKHLITSQTTKADVGEYLEVFDHVPCPFRSPRISVVTSCGATRPIDL